jgi:hypothetical protein
MQSRTTASRPKQHPLLRGHAPGDLVSRTVTDAIHFLVRVDGELTEEVREAFRPGIGITIAPEWGSKGADWWKSQLDEAGTPHFRVLVRAETPEQAREQVEAVFADIEGVSVRAVDRQTPFEVNYGRYEEITYRGIENLVVELMTGYAEEEERLWRLKFGREPTITIHSVTLRGSYPDTRLRVLRYDRARDLEQEKGSGLWQNEEFVAAAETIAGLRSWISDFLMYERGG